MSSAATKETTKSMFSHTPEGKFRRISDMQAHLGTGKNRPWYLDVNYVEEVAFEKAFSRSTRAA